MPQSGAASASRRFRPSFVRQRLKSGTEKVIYSFGGVGADGLGPIAGLTNVGGKLYGTTDFGGSHCGSSGCGTVFEVTTSGTERVVYSFKGGKDGANPHAGLIAVGGKLYGTTQDGGVTSGYCEIGCGTVFEVSTSGTESVLYRFNGEPRGDGAYPQAGLIAIGKELYGTTYQGGANENGTVFEVSTSGKESVLHTFGTNESSDGLNPYAGLIAIGKELYGTTVAGGAYGITGSGTGYGTIFEVSTSGKERILYSFDGYKHGRAPDEGLIAVGGNLYGTTPYGGDSDGDGIVFAVSISGQERILHTFKGGKDGETPEAGLIAVGSELYGTTGQGGKSSSDGLGGTVFEVSTSGAENVLYSFKDSPDGARPQAGLITVGGELYGTTQYGGIDGAGSVFAVTP
jgi:uncharacterized repeat protein (TIGR03803 family)